MGRSLATGTEIRNRASIVFDTNDPIETPEWLNTIDDSKPTSTAAVSPDPNDLGWNREDATVTLRAVDESSGVESLTWSAEGAQQSPSRTVPGDSVEIPVTAEGKTTVTYSATDEVGHASDPKTVTVKVDKTAPTATVSTPANDTTYEYGQAVRADYACADGAAGSGLAACEGDVPSGELVDTRSPVPQAFKVAARDRAGNEETKTVRYRVVDATPPVLTVPKTIVRDATGPAGVEVSYVASASDNADPSPVVSCRPASGSTFAIGTTGVECTAIDASGNEARKSFAVRVKGAAEQLGDLIALIESYDLRRATERKLEHRLVEAGEEVDDGDVEDACEELAKLVRRVAKEERKGRLSEDQASELRVGARRVMAVIDCGRASASLSRSHTLGAWPSPPVLHLRPVWSHFGN